jgi:dynein intermediate chain 2
MEYNIEAGPAKYLVGTEQGIVLSLNMRKRGGKTGSDSGVVQAMDGGSGKHHGPIYSIQRNPTHPTAYLTIGDWTARIWNEKNKTPIMMTPYCKSYLTAGCWSPTRAGVFYTCRNDGVLDVWDFFYRQNAVAYSHKVADYPLSSISVQGNPQAGGGRLIAVGDTNGTVSLLEVSENLAVSQANEKVRKIQSMSYFVV